MVEFAKFDRHKANLQGAISHGGSFQVGQY